MHDIAIVFLLCICCIYDCHVLQTNAELFFLICVNSYWYCVANLLHLPTFVFYPLCNKQESLTKLTSYVVKCILYIQVWSRVMVFGHLCCSSSSCCPRPYSTAAAAAADCNRSAGETIRWCTEVFCTSWICPTGTDFNRAPHFTYTINTGDSTIGTESRNNYRWVEYVYH